MNGIPDRWGLATLADLASDDKDIAYGVLKPGPQTPNGVPMLRVTDITSNCVETSAIYRISPQLDEEFRRTRLLGGEIVLSIQGTVGRVAIVPGDLARGNVSRTLAVIPLAVPEMGRWIWSAIQMPQVQEQIRGYIGGTTRDSFNLRDVRVLELPVPPLPEQHRIVAAIEDHFSRVDEAVALLERVQRNLKRYRASVLKAAVEGRLVPTEADLARAEGRTYEPASVLLERILEERRRRWKENGGRGSYKEPVGPDTADLPEPPEGWCWVELSSVADV